MQSISTRKTTTPTLKDKESLEHELRKRKNKPPHGLHLERTIYKGSYREELGTQKTPI